MRRSHSLRASALVALIALLGALGHVHGPQHGESAHAEVGLERALAKLPVDAIGEAGHAAPVDRPVVSNDDAHHEHSSRASLERTVCLACRSQAEDEAPRSTETAWVFAAATAARAPAPPTASAHPSRGRPGGPRAPPRAAA